MGPQEAIHQDADIQPPRRGQGMALAVDGVARAYDIRQLLFNGARQVPQYGEHLFVDLQNDGANPIYFYFDTQGATIDLNETTVTPAGNSGNPVLTLSTVVPKVLRAGDDAPVRIRRDQDMWLHVKSSAGSTLRIFSSSLSSMLVQ